MKSFLFTLLSISLFSYGFAQSAEEVTKYSVETMCECGSAKFEEIVPKETQAFMTKVGAMEQTKVQAFFQSLPPAERQKHLDNLNAANKELSEACSEAKIEGIILEKYPNAKEILATVNADTKTLNHAMTLIGSIEKCSYLKNTMVAILGLGMANMHHNMPVAPAPGN